VSNAGAAFSNMKNPIQQKKQSEQRPKRNSPRPLLSPVQFLKLTTMKTPLGQNLPAATLVGSQQPDPNPNNHGKHKAMKTTHHTRTFLNVSLASALAPVYELAELFLCKSFQIRILFDCETMP
jgi:hypothetical protein